MGNDGGTKALSRKYSRWGTKKEKAQVETEEAIQGKWSMCALSGETLQEPVSFSDVFHVQICSCELGYLFNKDVVIQAIIDKSLPPEFSHIRKLRDVVDLKFAVNPDYAPKYKGNSSDYWQQDILGGKYICPITKETIGGKTRFGIEFYTQQILLHSFVRLCYRRKSFERDFDIHLSCLWKIIFTR